MSATVRVYVRTGIVGAWAVFIGFALVLTASRLLTVMEPGAAESTNLATAAMPLSSVVWEVLQNLYSGGAVSVFVGVVLVLLGWFLILRSQ